jgi:hypothetical protein
MVIVNFPGMTGVTLETNAALTGTTGWIPMEGTFSDSITLLLPPGTQRIRGVVTSPARNISQEMVVASGVFNVIDIPTAELTITGIAIPGFDVRVQSATNGTHTNGALWRTYNNNQANTLQLHVFDTAGEDQWFLIQFNGLGMGGPRFMRQGFYIDLSDIFQTISIPESVSGVRLANATGGNMNIGTGNITGPRDVIVIKSETAATLTFTYNGTAYQVPFELDGTNPFDLFCFDCVSLVAECTCNDVTCTDCNDEECCEKCGCIEERCEPCAEDELETKLFVILGTLCCDVLGNGAATKCDECMIWFNALTVLYDFEAGIGGYDELRQAIDDLESFFQ